MERDFSDDDFLLVFGGDGETLDFVVTFFILGLVWLFTIFDGLTIFFTTFFFTVLVVGFFFVAFLGTTLADDFFRLVVLVFLAN